MIFLLVCSVVFAAMSTFRHGRTEWRTLAAASFLEWLATQTLDYTGIALFWAVSSIAFFGASALCFQRSLLGYYQASILAMTLCAYWLVEYDAANGTSIIYDNYKAVIYGLVGCQFLGAFPTLRAAYRDLAPGRGSRMADILRSKA